MNNRVAAVQQQPPPRGNPFYGVLGGGSHGMPVNNNNMPPPMLSAGLPSNFFPALQQQAAAAAQESSPPMVATAKLGPLKSNKDANSPLVVRSSVRKFNPGNNGIVSVAQWCRKCVEENLDWLVKLARRHHPKENLVLLVYGDGCETLVLMDEQTNTMPRDFRSIPKIGVGVSMAKIDDKGDEEKLAKYGVLQPTDSMWEHLHYAQQLEVKDEAKAKCTFIHTNISVWSDGMANRRRVLQIATRKPDGPLSAKGYVSNGQFELQVMAAWNGSATLNANAPQQGPAVAGETVITFNPKELIMLEKAFNETLTASDLKADCSKCTEKDAIAAQGVIHRALGLAGAAVKKRGRKPGPKKAVAGAEAKKQATPKKNGAKDKEDSKDEKDDKEGGDAKDKEDEQEEESGEEDDDKKGKTTNARKSRRASSRGKAAAKKPTTPKSSAKKKPTRGRKAEAEDSDSKEEKKGKRKSSRRAESMERKRRKRGA